MSWTKVTVTREAYKFLNRCPDCLRYGADQMLSISCDIEYYLEVEVPFCTACADKRLRYARYGKWLMFAGLATVIAIGIGFGVDDWDTEELLCLIGVAPGIWMMHFHGQRVRIADYSDQTVTFSFRHLEYAQEFRQLNSIAGLALSGKE